MLNNPRCRVRYALLLLAAMLSTDAAVAQVSVTSKSGKAVVDLEATLIAVRESFEEPVDRRAIEWAESQLLRVVQQYPESAEAHEQLGKIYLVTGRIKQAEDHFSQAVEAFPESLLALARIHVLQNKRDEARSDALRAERIFQKRVTANAADLESRLYLGESLLFLEQFTEAIAVLDAGAALDDDARLDRAKSRLYFIWSETYRREHGDLEIVYDLLTKALTVNPTNNMALRTLTRRLLWEADAQEKAVIGQTLAALSESHRDSGIIHFLLGLHDERNSDGLVAANHFQRAAALNDAAQHVREVAIALADSRDTETEGTLSLVDEALEVWPNHAQLQYARGYVLFKSERWIESLAELESAEKNGLHGDRRLHFLLSQVYQRTGHAPEVVEKHKRLAFPDRDDH